MRLREMNTPESSLRSICRQQSPAKEEELLQHEMQTLPCSGQGCAEDEQRVKRVMRKVDQTQWSCWSQIASQNASAGSAELEAATRLSARSLLKKRRLALRRLQEALSSFPRDSRRAALDAVPMRVKSALLRFMEVSTAASSTSSTSEGASTRRAFKRPPPLLCDQGMVACIRRRKVIGRLRERRGRHVVGVSLKQGGYIAQMRLVPYLQVVTRCQASLASAAALHKVLQRARQLISTDGAEEEESCGRKMQEAICCSCKEHSVAFADLGLSFCAVVDAHGVVGCTVSGSHSTCLEEALEQRRLLLAARDGGWGCLKRVWVQLMQKSVQKRSSGAWGRGCPKPKTRELAEAVANKAWQTFDLKRQSNRAKKLTKAICNLQRVLQAEDEVLPLSRKRRSPPAAFNRRAVVRFRERTELLHAKTRTLKRSLCTRAFDFGQF
eukprot:TRINITY_DN78951_c0_g1_i1.p1 TRINITY_DN78951_c0_g1~~TRINITY_DN78951_c0_g1_i1.p1  ORF type:complete len:439 (+),score=84.91 TRINITY_DN78951_c0_g1_i1:199-1515(+)